MNSPDTTNSQSLPIVVVLAAHDDGAGAHTTMCNIRDGIVNEYYSQNCGDQNRLFIVYLHGGTQTGFLKDYWVNPRKLVNSSQYHWEMIKGAPAISPSKNIDGVWIKVDNHLKFVKATDGSLDAAKTRNHLKKASDQIDFWPHVLVNLPSYLRDQIKLTVEMGVPQLSRWASNNNIPSIAVGDMLWSRTLRGSLKPAGEFDTYSEKSLHDISEMERLTNEVWLLPILAPMDYQDYLSDVKVVYQCLPRLIGSRPKEEDSNGVYALLQNEYKKLGKNVTEPEKIKEIKLIILAAGKTGVWKKIYSNLEKAFKAKFHDNSNFALAYPTSNGVKVIYCGRDAIIPDPGEMTKLFANAALCVTRGGVTIAEVIAAGKPSVIIQEPNHFLSQRQQEAAADRGLCFTAGLSQLGDPNTAIDKLVAWATDDKFAKLVRERCEQFDFDVEGWIGKQLVKRFLR